jgi:DNA processing protein
MRRLELGDEGYPPALLDLRDPPRVLWAIGDRATLRPPVVAIVGTRKATAYGERVTREIAGSLARAGACVVSGMARGIDGIAHIAALEADGRTVAVLGTGVDIAYPAGHRPLHARIRAHGLLLSEELPGAHAGPGSFPRRNRMIAALATVTIVVEAGVKSGAMITAGHALELGRTVAAVPGPIDAPQSAGTNSLVRDGATVIAEVADALQLVGLTRPIRRHDPTIATDSERAVWGALGDGALDVDTLAMRAGLPARECLAAITTLELSGAIECALTGEIRRRL